MVMNQLVYSKVIMVLNELVYSNGYYTDIRIYIYINVKITTYVYDDTNHNSVG